MRLRVLPLSLSLSICSLVCPAGAADVPSFAREVPAVRSGEPNLKFNGKDLTGFYAYTHNHKLEDPAKVFTVKDGLIRVSGEDFGAITTRDNFRDYHLIAEWKWG